jgi:CheY-like chemotaxis protein
MNALVRVRLGKPTAIRFGARNEECSVMIGAGNHSTIVVAEDEAIVAFDISNRLSHMGFHVEAVVASGEDAIAAARKYHPDFMLMDIGLKGMDGVSAAKVINDELGTRISFMSAYAVETMETVVAVVPHAGYLRKPFSDTDLRHVVLTTD